MEGKKIATRKEVADLAGVSEATVSRVLNGVGPMKEETKAKVLEAAEQLGYFPNAIAQSFARRKSGNLGVILPYVPKVHLFSTYYFSEILSGIGEAVREHGYDLLLMLRTPDEDADYSKLFRSQKVDGCIILGSQDLPGERNSLRRLREQHFPFCLVNQHFEGEQFSEVDADHKQGSYEAVKHLIEGGCRKIAFVNGSPQYSNSADRLEGYRKALQKGELPYREELVFVGNYSRKSGYEAVEALLPIREEIDAIFAANDRMAIGIMQAMKENGWIPGKDAAVVGYDDSDAAKLMDPPLTTVTVPFYEMGYTAAGKLLEQIGQGSAEPFHEKLNVRLKVRKSSKTT